MQLTQEQLEQYRTNGYLLIRNLIPAEELAPVRRRLKELVAGDHDWPAGHFQVVDPTRFRNVKGDPMPFGVQLPAQREALFDHIRQHPNLRDAMSGLLGGPVQPFTDQAILRSGEVQGAGSFYHQDSYYWHIAPQAGCNVWITLNEVGPEAGALAIMPGTQQDWTLEEHEDYFDDPSMHNAHTGEAFPRYRIPADKIDFSGEDLLLMQPGDAVFFSNYTWHRAEGNFTGEDKYAYAIAYQLAETGVE